MELKVTYSSANVLSFILNGGQNEFKEICHRSKIVLDDSKIDVKLILAKTEEPVQMKHMAMNVHVWLVTVEQTAKTIR